MLMQSKNEIANPTLRIRLAPSVLNITRCFSLPLYVTCFQARTLSSRMNPIVDGFIDVLPKCTRAHLRRFSFPFFLGSRSLPPVRKPPTNTDQVEGTSIDRNPHHAESPAADKATTTWLCYAYAP